jgi:hypothetical protein
MRKPWNVFAAIMLTGCSAPFADRIVYDSEIRNSPGTITLSSPKLYTREALISERARDVKWINGLIAQSEDTTKVVFKPELVREVEQITAMAAAIGLKFDPLSELAYRRDKETGDMQHEISKLKLQLQLDQLKKDIGLIRTNFESQTAPVNEDINKLSEASSSNSTSFTASAADQLKAAIDQLNAALAARLDADGKLPAATTLTSSPYDDFRDRSAYRDMLKAANNSAGLDELHDYANARLIRLNFQATVIPDSKNLRSLGAIQVHVRPPKLDDLATRRFLKSWLEYVNTSTAFRSGKTLNIKNPTIAELLLSGSFEKVDILGIELLLPVVRGTQTFRPSEIYEKANWKIAVNCDSDNYESALTPLSSLNTERKKLRDALCYEQSMSFITTLNTFAACPRKGSTINSDTIESQLFEAISRKTSSEYILLADKVARTIGQSSVFTADLESKLKIANNFREEYHRLFEGDKNCSDFAGTFEAAPIVWEALLNKDIKDNDEIRIYEIGPREQVQQVSTVARSATSLALAASIAASNPGSGIGADAAASYSNQTMGRATALERVPSVVGYSQVGSESFGWVLGPHAVLNAKGRVDMAQLLKTYDLSVDMSVPGWWPEFDLEVSTVWAPSPTLITATELPRNESDLKSNTVPLVRYSADDFNSLTQYMLGVQNLYVNIDDIKGGPINACEKSNLLITGKNIWRAKQIFVLGQIFGEDSFTITADMKSILLTVPAISPLKNGLLSEDLHVITPLGMSTPYKIDYINTPSGEGCKPAKAQTTEADKDTVSITDINPQEFFIPSAVTINIAGSNLNKIVEVQLAGQPAKTINASADGKSLMVVFEKSATESVRAADNTAIKFFEKDKKTGKTSTSASVTKFVRTQR